jgi:cytoskeleton protein RodZ
VPELGARLREARVGRGLELVDAEAATKIRARYLLALEQERFGDVPDGYAKTFLHTYAAYLGLPSALLGDEYNRRFSTEEPLIAHTPPRRVRRARAVPVVLGATVLVLAAVLLAADQFGSRHHARRLAVKPAQAPGTADRTPRTVPHARSTRTPSRPKPVPLVVSAARGDCWLSVRVGSKQGSVLYESMLARGHALSFTARRLWVRLGAPNHVDLTLNRRHLTSFAQAWPINLYVTSSGVVAAPPGYTPPRTSPTSRSPTVRSSP